MAVDEKSEILYRAERIGFIGECDKNTTICKSGDFRQFTEKRTQPSMSFSNVILCIVCVLLFLCNLVQAQGCDFTGSGLHADGRGVRPVYLSCSSGKVQWDYPRGALRVVLTLPHSNSEFRACIKLARPVEGARAFLEGHRTLLPIHPENKRTKCFSSYSGRVAIYIEALPARILSKNGALFEYDLQEYPGELYDPSEECRPCTDPEIVRHYCSADFVAKGKFTREHQNEEDEMSVLTFSASRVLRQTTTVFSAVHTDGNHLNHIETSNGQRFTGNIQVPSHCHARIGPEEFLVLGYIRLGDPLLKCAAKMKDWRRIVENSQNDIHCILEV